MPTLTRTLIGRVAALAMFATALVTPPAQAVATCDIPYIAAGSNSEVDGTVVSVTSSNNTKDGGTIGWTNYYWHDVASGGGGSTVWTFAEPVASFISTTGAHTDGSPLNEKYELTGYDANGNIVLSYTAEDVNETVTHTPSAAVSRLELEFTPLVGIYGSVIRLSLPRKGELCTEPESVDADVVAVADLEAVVGLPWTAHVVTLSNRCHQAERWVEVSPDPRDGTGTFLMAPGTTATADWLPGEYEVVAVYGGDGNCDPGSSGPVRLTVHPAPTSVDITADSEISVGNELSVSTRLTSLGNCSGTVTVEITPDPLTGTGSASISAGSLDTSDWLAGDYTLSATYGGDVRCLEAAPDTTTLTLNRAETSLELTTADSLEVGQDFSTSVELIAEIDCEADVAVALSPNPLTGTGELLLAPGTSTTEGWLPGSYTVSARFAGDGRCEASESAARTLVVTTRPVEPPAPGLRKGTVRVYFGTLSSRLWSSAKETLRSIPVTAVKVRATGFVQGDYPKGNTNSLARARMAAAVRHLRSLGFEGEVDSRVGGVSQARGGKARVVVIQYWYYATE